MEVSNKIDLILCVMGHSDRNFPCTSMFLQYIIGDEVPLYVIKVVEMIKKKYVEGNDRNNVTQM